MHSGGVTALYRISFPFVGWYFLKYGKHANNSVKFCRYIIRGEKRKGTDTQHTENTKVSCCHFDGNNKKSVSVIAQTTMRCEK
jgi:hypothetical protein